MKPLGQYIEVLLPKIEEMRITYNGLDKEQAFMEFVEFTELYMKKNNFTEDDKKQFMEQLNLWLEMNIKGDKNDPDITVIIF